MAIPVSLVAAVTGAVALNVFFMFLEGGGPVPGSALVGAAFGAASGVIFCLAAGISWRSSRLRY